MITVQRMASEAPGAARSIVITIGVHAEMEGLWKAVVAEFLPEVASTASKSIITIPGETRIVAIQIRHTLPLQELLRLPGIMIPIRTATADLRGKASSVQHLLTHQLLRGVMMQAEVQLLPGAVAPADRVHDRHAVTNVLP